MEYTPKQLTRFYLQDLVVDIRCARRDGLTAYAASCVHKFQSLWPHRHKASISKYGIPV